jgi:hypothetical protein
MERLDTAIRFARKSRFPRCAICYAPPNGKRVLAQDHCHDTGQIRGFLCLHCNTGLGHFKDDPRLLRRAARYLTRFKAISFKEAAETAETWAGFSRHLPEKASDELLVAKQLIDSLNARCRAEQAHQFRRRAHRRKRVTPSLSRKRGPSSPRRGASDEPLPGM